MLQTYRHEFKAPVTRRAPPPPLVRIGECPVERLGGRRVRDDVAACVERRRNRAVDDHGLASELVGLGFTRDEARRWVDLVEATEL